MTDFTEDSALTLSVHEQGYDPIEDRLRAEVCHVIEATVGDRDRVIVFSKAIPSILFSTIGFL